MSKIAFNILPVTLGKKNPETRRLPPSLNARMHWAERRKWNDAFAEQIGWTIQTLNIGKHRKAKVQVVNYTTHPTDLDNGYASLKCLLDTIVRMGVVPDDDEKHMDVEFWNERVRHRNEERVEVTIKARKLRN